MNSRLDRLVLSDYYSIYVTTAPPFTKLTRRDPCFFIHETYSPPFYVISKGEGYILAANTTELKNLFNITLFKCPQRFYPKGFIYMEYKSNLNMS